MSGTVSRRRAAGRQAETLGAAGSRGGRRRRRGGWVALGIVVVVAAGAGLAWRAGVFAPAGSPGAGRRGAAAAGVARVVRADLSATMPVAGTLGYAGSYAVTGPGGGTLTWLPAAGRVVWQGQVLYETGNGSPVVLLYGSVPAWRAMSAGVTGQDVSQLNHDLVRLGYADSAGVAALGWDYYSQETAYGVQRLEEGLGVASPPGGLSLGQVVFEPEALRVAAVTGRLGGPASGPVLTATSGRHVVSVALDVSEQSYVKAGEKVSVTLPDGAAAAGVVSAVGTVATAPSSPGPGGSEGSSGSATIPVHVKLTRPAAAGRLDQAPVTVSITTASVKNVLAVPVTALLARSGGGYAVEVTGPRNTRRLVPVRPGLFDDASGLVQVTGALTPGERVVVAAS